MSLPLPPRKCDGSFDEKGNRGLYWTKFFDQWEAEFCQPSEPWRDQENKIDYYGGKMNWILAQSFPRQNRDGIFRTDGKDQNNSFKTGNAPALKTMAGRQACLADKLGGEAKTFRSNGPFVTGMGLSHPVENGFLFHHTLGVPYLPGSSIKGMIRAFAKQEGDADTATVHRLFGRSDEEGGPSVGSVIVFDALPIAPVDLVAEIITPHTGDWRITKTPAGSPPADWVSPNPIPFLAVDEGTEFQFALAARCQSDTAEKDLKTAWDLLEDALNWIGAGAKTAIGFGQFVATEKLPLNKGDRVEILAGDHADKFIGRVGTIMGLLPAPSGERAKISEDKGERKIKGTFSLESLKRISKNPGA